MKNLTYVVREGFNMDSILSVRINEDLKNKFLSLAEEAGTNNKEFMDLIIRSYEMNKTASKTEYVKDDVDELQNIIARIMSIYMNMVERHNVKLTSVESNYSDAIEKESQKANNLMEEIKVLQSKLQEAKEEKEVLKNKLDDASEAISKEKENANDYKELNSMLKQKLTDFNRISEENITLISDNNKLKDEVLHLKETSEHYRKDLEKQRLKISELEEKLKAEESSREEVLEDSRNQLQKKYELLIDEVTLKSKSEIFQKEEVHRNELWNLKNEYENRISGLIKDKELLLNKLESATINTNKDK